MKSGLYDPRHERDGCGVGFVADIGGRPSHDILTRGLEAVAHLDHRGAVSADGKTGDGAGVLTQIPRKLFTRVLEEKGLPAETVERLAVGVLFLPGDDAEARETAREIVERAVIQAGLYFLGWRDVPLGRAALGRVARRSCPRIRQVLMARPADLDEEAFESLLFLTRKRIERRAAAARIEPFYIPSLSHRTVVYKGLMTAPQLSAFYPDLADPDYETALTLFHQRYSTNTFPSWTLAQPFRLLAHNGEINTLGANVQWMRARQRELERRLAGGELEELVPLLQEGSSDSGLLDNALELLVRFRRDPLHALLMMVPAALWEGEGMDSHGMDSAAMDPDVRAFYEFHSSLMEPWDGPAALVFSDGRRVGAALDRNGLRPQRWWRTASGLLVMGSEAGIVRLPADEVVEKGRIGPGQMLAVDLEEGELLHSGEIKRRYARRRPYRERVERVHEVPPALGEPWQGYEKAHEPHDLHRAQLAFGYGTEDLERLVEPMSYEGTPPVGSMGDDTPLAVMSHRPQTLDRYFKQRFAQVTNPPIDPLRERGVMSLDTRVGAWGEIRDERSEADRVVELPSPVVFQGELDWLTRLDPERLPARTFDALFPVEDGPEGLEPALEALCDEVVAAAREGTCLLVLTDRRMSAERVPLPMLLAVSAVHHRLMDAGLRMGVSLICDTGFVREDHQLACLVGFGATVVHPWLAFESAVAVAAADPRGSGLTPAGAVVRMRRALEAGLLKIMSKLGVCPVASYHGGQLFQVLGLDEGLVERWFPGTVSHLGGMDLAGVAADHLAFHERAFRGAPELDDLGVYRFRKQGEYHAFNPQVFKALHKAVRTGDESAWETYATAVDTRPPCTVRDALRWKPGARPVPLDEVEPAEEIARRFTTGAMSHGALSREAHEVLAVAMNRLGGKSNSGEGGEAAERLRPYREPLPAKGSEDGVHHASWRPECGDWGNSAIKQVASGRFGVTAEYLASAREIEIKMAQGSKPGEGGQIPGKKVSPEIAAIRRSVPGVTLISPPPHHDIYSIEDLAQLIYDLKRVNREARVTVKLVAGAGVGTIAAGVAKGYADGIQISGADGGTGASPLSSIKHAGAPWELGLAESQQVLVLNNLRGRVTLRVDGGLKTGRDVVLAALLGAEEYGFGTAALVAEGCIMARQCHLDTCPVGVASQRPELRIRFPGRPEHVVRYFLHVAAQVRRILAEMGFRSLEEIVGRNDLLEPRDGLELRHGAGIDLSALLADPDPEGARVHRCQTRRNDRPEGTPPLDEVVWRDCEPAVQSGGSFRRSYRITNRDRSVGARLAGEIARRRLAREPEREEGGTAGPEAGALELEFHGVAGQSFGAFLPRGVCFALVGEAQDYVGKGLSGGELVLAPPPDAPFAASGDGHRQVICGNTVLYGATGGRLFAAGRAGERLCVRNSGAVAVVEGCGDHGCEYMTRGVTVVLGATGRNFGAGMSGGLAYVFDPRGVFPARLNPGMVELAEGLDGMDERLLRELVEHHRRLTGSTRAADLLADWEAALGAFRKVVPKPPEGADEEGVERQGRARRNFVHRVLEELHEGPHPTVVAEAGSAAAALVGP